MNFHGANVLAWCVEFVQMLVHRLPVLGDRVGVIVLLDSRGGLPRLARDREKAKRRLPRPRGRFWNVDQTVVYIHKAARMQQHSAFVPQRSRNSPARRASLS